MVQLSEMRVQVSALTLDQVSFVLTGDCEAENWPQIVAELDEMPGLAVHQPASRGRFGSLLLRWF